MDKPPPLKFGDRGELTEETIDQVDLTPEERARALEMVEVQAAYLHIIDSMGAVIDPSGNHYDLSALQPIAWATAWTLALSGWRQTATPYIRKHYPVGMQGAYTWVDARIEDKDIPPPQTRHRDEMLWEGVKPEIVVEDEPRPEWMR